MLVHIVIFWLKDDAPQGTRERMIGDCAELLGKIPSVTHLRAGRPAMTPRDVVDNSYDVALSATLTDDAGLDVYQKHELHQEFLRRHKQHWKRILVYDFH